MNASQHHLCLRIAVDESDRYEGKPLYHGLIAFLQAKGIAGATVFRSIEGFGASGVLHSERAIDAISSFTMLIESIDEADRIIPLLDDIRSMIRSGLITVEPIDVHALTI